MDSGIYKWVSPSGRIYVGQSKNISSRLKWYKGGHIKSASMPKLKRSFSKYGIENHIFEIIEYCSLDKLNEREIFWGLKYNTLNEGLNCKLGEQNCVFSDSTKEKMGKAKQGFKLSPESEVKRQTALRKVWDRKNKIRIENKMNKPKYIFTKEHKDNMSKSRKGKPIHTEESKEKLSQIGKKRDMTSCWEASRKKRSLPINQYDLEGNFIKRWNSASAAEKFFNPSLKVKDNIRACIRGKQKSAYGFIWRSESQFVYLENKIRK